MLLTKILEYFSKRRSFLGVTIPAILHQANHLCITGFRNSWSQSLDNLKRQPQGVDIGVRCLSRDALPYQNRKAVDVCFFRVSEALQDLDESVEHLSETRANDKIYNHSKGADHNRSNEIIPILHISKQYLNRQAHDTGIIRLSSGLQD
eukprot:TRINITY_DN1023_c0_g1_i6.p1 TRINITY_DN1023_c0_g1~~TRINITY_DN1023_c0_g1_i6.p1  ORF type:complete len:149 (-),score=15.67 TRINITY_DN1023_c0_g1_i6:129-575(-)